jgi:hypothetical protein
LLHLLQHRITNKSLAQADYKQTLINTISGPKRQLTTKSCTPESNKDVASSGARPRPSSPSWPQGLSLQNSLLRIHPPAKDHHPNHRSPLVFSTAPFYFKFSTKNNPFSSTQFFHNQTNFNSVSVRWVITRPLLSPAM